MRVNNKQRSDIILPLEELAVYAGQGLSIGQVSRMLKLSNDEIVRRRISKETELKAKFLANGKLRQIVANRKH